MKNELKKGVKEALIINFYYYFLIAIIITVNENDYQYQYATPNTTNKCIGVI
jgi:hypothetical protein